MTYTDLHKCTTFTFKVYLDLWKQMTWPTKHLCNASGAGETIAVPMCPSATRWVTDKMTWNAFLA